MEKVIDEKCLNCGATIKYNPKLKKFKCEYCGAEFELEDFKKTREKINKEIDLTKEFSKMEEMEGYVCKNCGATIVSLENISSTTCLYCKSNAIIKNRLSGIYKPDSIILFKYQKEEAIKEWLNLCKGRLLIPKGFKDESNIKELEGLYVPFWLYDVTNSAYLRCDGTRVATWMDSRYIYTKTDYYKVERGGDLSFVSVPNDAATRFDDVIMNAIEPFDYKDLIPFETTYLSGFLSEKFDVEMTDAYLNAKTRIETDSKNYLRSDMKGYATLINKESKNDLKINNTSYVLLPVFVLNIKYNDKIYHFAMNGQTKKMVGEIPVSKSKLLLLILVTFVLSFGIIILILKLGGYRW
ncbi:MAG: hypothetical protein IJ068_06540 [Bacilli bacterium]|nr:hypothetical protein [Bacilli bacterium]